MSLAALVTIGTSACTQLDNLLARVPIFSFMHDSPALSPYDDPRTSPPGSIPFASGSGDVPPPIEANEGAMVEFGDTTPNPLPDSPEVIQIGQAKFIQYCVVCHGPGGKGDGPLVQGGWYPQGLTRDLTLPATAERTDGYMYAVIRNGRGLMGPYGDRATDRERWAIVHYIRRLQEGAGTLPGAEPAETGEPTSGGPDAEQERD